MGAAACAVVSPAASVQANVTFNEPAAVVHTGAATSTVQVTVLVTVEMLPQASVEVNVLVCEEVHPVMTTAASVALTVTVPQLSVAVAEPSAAFICAADGLHVTGKGICVTVIVGEIKSTILVVAGDSIHPAIVFGPAGVEPHAAVRTYLVLILYPLQLLAVGGVLVPQVRPSSKLYSMVKPAIVGGGVTIIAPQPALTVGAGGGAGNITTFTVLLTAHAPGPTANAALPPQAELRT